MFYNWFQTGSSLELYNPTSKDLLPLWEFSGASKLNFDTKIKSYNHLLNVGGLSKMKLPKGKHNLGIVQGFLVLQTYLFTTKNFTIEIAISDTENIRHRLIFSTHIKEISANFFTCIIPIPELPLGEWINLSLDVLSFVSVCFKNLTFKSIDSIVLSGSLKIRRIFTMRGKIKDANFGDEGENASNISNDRNNNSLSSLENGKEEIPKKHMINVKGVKVYNYNLDMESLVLANGGSIKMLMKENERNNSKNKSSNKRPILGGKARNFSSNRNNDNKNVDLIKCGSGSARNNSGKQTRQQSGSRVNSINNHNNHKLNNYYISGVPQKNLEQIIKRRSPEIYHNNYDKIIKNNSFSSKLDIHPPKVKQNKPNKINQNISIIKNISTNQINNNESSSAISLFNEFSSVKKDLNFKFQ